MSEENKIDDSVIDKLFERWGKKRAEEAATMCAKRTPTECDIDRAMVIGKWFCEWNDKTGPCPISILTEHWGKKLCSLFEWIAVLEADLRKVNRVASKKRIVGFSVGDFVSPKTLAGLELGDVAVNGEYKQDMKTACVFSGTGVVKDIKRCTIDYDLWDLLDGRDCSNLGEVEFTSYLIECENGLGWAGMGAIVPTEMNNERKMMNNERTEKANEWRRFWRWLKGKPYILERRVN